MEASVSRATDAPSDARHRRWRLSTLKLTTRVAALGCAATLGIGAGLAWQMSKGGDPSLGSKTQGGAATQARRTVVKTTVIRRIQPASSSGSSSTSTSSSSNAGYATSPAPVTSGTS